MARAIAPDVADDVLRAIENNGEVTLPTTSEGFSGVRRQYRFVFVAVMAAYFVRRQLVRALRRH